MHQDAPDEPLFTTTTQEKYVEITAQPTSSPTTTSYSTVKAVALQEITLTTGMLPPPPPTATTFQAYNPTWPGPALNPTTTTSLTKRSYESSQSDVSNYPKLIKMVEKRKPYDPNEVHVEPYCQKMQVLDNWDIVPVPSVETLCIEEILFPTPSYASKDKRNAKRDDARDVIQELESYCICEWTSQ